MKIFLDSNIFLRFFTPEDAKTYQECGRLIKEIEVGSHQPYVSAIVVLECGYVLQKLYKFSSKQVEQAIETVLSMRNLTVIETTNTKRAFAFHKKTHVKLSDCLIARQVPAGVTLVTYDREFSKLPGLTVRTPKEIIG